MTSIQGRERERAEQAAGGDDPEPPIDGQRGGRRRRIACAPGARAGLSIGLLALVLAQAASGAPPMRIGRMTLVASTGAVQELLVSAEHAVVDVEAQRAELEGVRATWAREDGAPSLELTCDRGEFDLATNDLLAVGSVQGRLYDGRRFEGPWLRYDRAKGVAFTDAPVKIVDEGRMLRGGGLRYHVRSGRLRLTAGASFVETP
jgi:LPS export ABC transporter protein LptC